MKPLNKSHWKHMLVWLIPAWLLGLGSARAQQPGGHWRAGAYQVAWPNLSITRISSSKAPQLLLQGLSGQWLTATQSRLQVHEQRGSFQFADQPGQRCQQLHITAAAQHRQTLQLTGHWQEPGCQQSWQLKLSLASAGHLRLEARLSPGPLNQLGLQLQTQPDEQWFGGGEQFSHPRLNGQKLPVWVQENGIGRGQEPVSSLIQLFSPGSAGHTFSSYISVPWLMSNASRGLALENHQYSEWDLTRPDVLGIKVWSPQLDLRLLGGETPLDLLRRYTDWAGRMPEPPAWADQGAWVGMQGGTARVRAVWQQLAAQGTPLAAFWLQDWVGKRTTRIGSQLWWNWELNRRQYPDWPQLQADLQHKGIRVLGYLNPFLVDVGQADLGQDHFERHLYAEAKAHGYLVKNAQGEPFQVANTDFAAGMLDLSQPQARNWFKQVIRDQLLSQGFSGWMADYGEALPLDARLASGESAASFHNRYAEAWARLQREVIAQNPELLVFLRAGYTRSPRWAPLFWEGDQTVSWDGDDGLASSVTGLISAGLSGFSLNHSDAGGYTSICQGGIGLCRSPELLMRWLEANAWTPFLRTHEGNQPQAQAQFYSSPELLQSFDRNARIYKAWRFLRRQLFQTAATTGAPVVRHMILHYPQDPVAPLLQDQYLLGPDLLVAPVLSPGATQRTVYLPPGPWIHLWSGSRQGLYTRGSWVTVPAPLGQPPVFYRSGSPIGPQLLANLRHEQL